MIALVFLIHYIGDFVFQSRAMGRNKSKSLVWLLKHVFTYAAILGVLSYPLFSTGLGFAFWIVINFYLHLITDFITSKCSTHYYLKEKEYAFWNVIGIDQIIHVTTLYYTFIWLS